MNLKILFQYHKKQARNSLITKYLRTNYYITKKGLDPMKNKIWKNKNSSRFNGLSKRSFHKKEKSPIICYECKNPGHFKLECPDLEKP